MSVKVHMMSGYVMSVNIFYGFRIRNLRNEVYNYIRDNSIRDNDDEFRLLVINNSDRLLFSKFGDDEEIDDYDFVKNDDVFRVFVKPNEDIPSSIVRLTLGDNNIICLRNDDGFLIDYYGWEIKDRFDDLIDTERQVNMPNRNIILEVDINHDGYDIMRQDIRQSVEDERDRAILSDDFGESILDDLDDDNRTFEIFFDRFMRLNDVDVVDIVYINEADEYDPEDDVDGDQEWD